MTVKASDCYVQIDRETDIFQFKGREIFMSGKSPQFIEVVARARK